MSAETFLSEKARTLRQGAIRAMFDRAAGMTDVISMGIGEPDMPTPAPICQACAEGLAAGYTHYTANAGLPALREALSQRALARPGLYSPKDEIVVTIGGMGALTLLMQVVLDPGDEVLIQDPQWLNYAVQVAYCGGTPVRVPAREEDGLVLRAEAVEARITPRTRALILNSPNNPTGRLIPPETLERLADTAKRHDLLVISDEVYSTLVYGGAEAVSISSLPGMKERTAVVGSFSKAYAMTGWRIGYVAAPAPVAERMTRLQEYFNACASAPGQYAAVRALERPELAAGIRDVFARRRALALDALAKIPGLRPGTPEGAFYLFPDVSAFGLGSEEFCARLLDEARVVCIPGAAFGACGEGHVRMSYAVPDARLPEALRRFSAFCASL